MAVTHALAHTDDRTAQDVLADVLTGVGLCAFGQLDRDRRTARLVDGAPGADALVLLDPFSDGAILFSDPSMWTTSIDRLGFDVTRTCAEVLVDPTGGRPLRASSSRQLFGLLLAARNWLAQRRR